MRNIKIITALLVISLIVITFTVSFSTSILNSGSDSVSCHGSVVIGSSENGYVVKFGPYGNCRSSVKIAYIVGVHPLESRSHTTMINALKANEDSLRYCYYIYQVNVTKNADDYSAGRYNGQVLARDFVVPDASTEHFKLAVDVHSNVGNWAEKTFLFSPVNGTRSEELGLNITGGLNWLAYYTPPSSTSPEFVTIPLINAGIPSVIYESYSKDSDQTVQDHANEFVINVDNLENLD